MYSASIVILSMVCISLVVDTMSLFVFVFCLLFFLSEEKILVILQKIQFLLTEIIACVLWVCVCVYKYVESEFFQLFYSQFRLSYSYAHFLHLKDLGP